MEGLVGDAATLTEMHPNLATLQRLDELDRLIAVSDERPVLLFKHSYTCGVSAEALDELIAHLDDEIAGVQYAMVTVQTHREVSNAVSTRLGGFNFQWAWSSGFVAGQAVAKRLGEFRGVHTEV